MAQGSKKFKAQRPGASKKPQQNKQKGPKKGGMIYKSHLLSNVSREKVVEAILVKLHQHVTCVETAEHVVRVTPVYNVFTISGRTEI